MNNECNQIRKECKNLFKAIGTGHNRKLYNSLPPGREAKAFVTHR